MKHAGHINNSVILLPNLIPWHVLEPATNVAGILFGFDLIFYFSDLAQEWQ